MNLLALAVKFVAPKKFNAALAKEMRSRGTEILISYGFEAACLVKIAAGLIENCETTKESDQILSNLRQMLLDLQANKNA